MAYVGDKVEVIDTILVVKGYKFVGYMALGPVE
jgi:hypothetical protein